MCRNFSWTFPLSWNMLCKSLTWMLPVLNVFLTKCYLYWVYNVWIKSNITFMNCYPRKMRPVQNVTDSKCYLCKMYVFYEMLLYKVVVIYIRYVTNPCVCVLWLVTVLGYEQGDKTITRPRILQDKYFDLASMRRTGFVWAKK